MSVGDYQFKYPSLSLNDYTVYKLMICTHLPSLPVWSLKRISDLGGRLFGQLKL